MDVNSKIIRYLFVLAVLLNLSACASSSYSHNAANNIDAAYYNTKSAITSTSNTNIGDGYLNATETGQGMVVGGVVGGAVGGLAFPGGGGWPGAAGGAIVGGYLGAMINARSTIVDRLENHGAKVFVMGDHVLIVLPANRIFSGFSSHLNPHASSTMDLVAELIRGVSSISVKISVYGNGSGAEQVSQTISVQQADALVKYLWPRVSTRVLTASGQGNNHLVDQAGSKVNYRVEISLVKLPT